MKCCVLGWLESNKLLGVFCSSFISRAFPGIGRCAKGISPPSQKDEFFLAISILICVRVIFSGDPLVDQYVWLILAETVKIHSLTRPPTSFSFSTCNFLMAQSNKLANQYQCKSCTAFWWQNMCCNTFSSPKPLWVTKSFRNKNHTWSYNCVAFDANKPLPRNLSFRLICQSLWSKMDPLSSFSRTGSAIARKATKCWKIVCVLCVCVCVLLVSLLKAVSFALILITCKKPMVLRVE